MCSTVAFLGYVLMLRFCFSSFFLGRSIKVSHSQCKYIFLVIHACFYFMTLQLVKFTFSSGLDTIIYALLKDMRTLVLLMTVLSGRRERELANTRGKSELYSIFWVWIQI